MTVNLDPEQQRVAELDITRHARILGAPGTGKTLLVKEQARQLLVTGVMRPEELLVIDEQRVGARMLRDTIEQDLEMPLTGTLVRTPSSLAFALLNEAGLAAGNPEYTLLSGSREDDIVLKALHGENGLKTLLSLGAPEEVRDNLQFRSEIRDVLRVLDDAGQIPSNISAIADAFELHPELRSLPGGLAARWRSLKPLLEHIRDTAHEAYPYERTSSESLREATHFLATAHDVKSELIPRLMLIDRASDLSHGALSLIAQLVNHGTIVWCFGDPDSSTMAYQGDTTHILHGIEQELLRRGARPEAFRFGEQSVTLNTVHRHGDTIRGLIRDLSTRLGTSGGWEHRQAVAAVDRDAVLQFTTTPTFAQLIGVIAHRLRERYLGISGKQIPWEKMAVICRSRDEVEQVAGALEDAQVPTLIDSGGMVLKRFPVIRHLVTLLQDALGFEAIQMGSIMQILTGPIGGLDPISIRRLESAIMHDERALAFVEQRTPQSLVEIVIEFIDVPERIPDTAEGRTLQKIQGMIANARQLHGQGSTPREVLWSLWERCGMQDQLRDRALNGGRQHATFAHETLDAVMQLFFTLQRHEEQVSEVPVAELLTELLQSDIPQDSIVMRSLRPAVTVTTPQGAATQEFSVVCIAGPQEGVWPNLKPRAGITGAQQLEQFLRGDLPTTSQRTDTLHSELRLFLNACSRATDELLVVAREDDEEFPSAFFHLGNKHRVEGLPNTTITLETYTAQLRRKLISNPDDVESARELAFLAGELVQGAPPEHWYGMLPPSTELPLYNERMQEGLPVPVSPSQIESVEQCPLNWFVSSLNLDTASPHAKLGTLLHSAFERISSGNVTDMRKLIDAEWGNLSYESDWESEKAREVAYQIVEGIAAYLSDSRAQHTEIIANEGSFTLTLGNAELRGKADRIELVESDEGKPQPKVVDLKTGSASPRQAEITEHAQLLAYQLGLEMAEFTFETHPDQGVTNKRRFGESGGASLLFVHPAYQSSRRSYKIMEQHPMTEEQRELFIARVQDIAQTIAANAFTARVEHHCDASDGDPACRIHIIPAVSYE